MVYPESGVQLIRSGHKAVAQIIARRGGDVMSYAEAKVGLKVMRARGSLAKTVSGYSYSRRSKGSATEGSVKGSVFRESGAACCIQKRAIWRARRSLYIEEIRAFNGGGRRRRPTPRIVQNERGLCSLEMTRRM